MRNAYLDATRVQRGRTRRCVAINLSEEALSILRHYCPTGTKQVGEFVSLLLVERQARDDERARMRAEVVAVLG